MTAGQETGRGLEYVRRVLSDPYVVDLDVRSSDAAPVALATFHQTAHEYLDPGDDNLMIGHGLRASPGVHDLRFGDQAVSLDLSRPDGVYVNAPYVEHYSHQHVAFDLLALVTSMDHAAGLVGLDEPDLAAAIRPLHDDAIYEDPLLVPMMRSMWAATEVQGHDGASVYVEQATQTLLLYLVNRAHGHDWGKPLFRRNEAATPGEFLSAEMPPLDRVRLERARDYIDANLGGSIRLADIARAAATSPSTLSRTFKAATGMSVWAHVLSRRLDRAAAMLRARDTPISQVAYACGFSSQAHLTTAFRARYGATPSNYRRASG
ncbi:MAG: AraC family transcriptional regulator [Pseudomonadota bacterium]